MNVLITDDHPVVRRGLVEILKEGFPGSRCVEAADGQEMLLHLAHSPFDLLLLDLTLPGCSGLDLLPEVTLLYPKLPIIVLSGRSADQYAARCLDLGASAYICKDSQPEDLLEAIRKDTKRARHVGSFVAEAFLVSLGGPAHKAKPKALSAREGEVLLFIAEGMSLKEIAGLLRVSTKTIGSFRARIMQKMELKSNSQLIRYALVNHLIE